jgi:2-iminobutanoate/2-iminopropanoate deaminase
VKEALQPAGLATPTKPYSPVVVSGDLVAVSGQIPIDVHGELVEGGFAEQLQQVFRNLTACLDAAGCDQRDVIKVVAYLTDRGDFAEFNEGYAAFFAEPRPVRTTIVCGLMDERFLVEIDVIAHARRAEAAG